MLAIPLKKYPGKFGRSSFVLAFVKKEELTRFAMEGQPIKAIARYFERDSDTIDRALGLLHRFEVAIANMDINTVAKEVWKNRLGWEKSGSFLEARAYILRGELMPKETCGPQKSSRRNTKRVGKRGTTSVVSSATGGAPVSPLSSQPAPDDFLESLSHAPVLTDAVSVAAGKMTDHGRPR